jgi:hypothetical protein
MTRAGCALLLLLVAAGAHGQRPQVAVLPEAITVGDVFHAAIRLDVPPGASIVAPDALELPEDIEQAGHRVMRVDTAGGANRVTVLYPLTAWRPGGHVLPPATIGYVADGARQETVAEFPAFAVRSVLPADTTGVEPRPARDVLGASRLWWPILLAVLLAAIMAAALAWWWRRRRRDDVPVIAVVPAVPPRAAALARLDELARSDLLARGDFRTFYQQLTAVLRRYAAAVEPAWGVDLTTSELAGRMRVRDAGSVELLRILGAADLVKFAKADAAADAARRDLAAARTWVEQTGEAAAAGGATAATDLAERRVA